MFPFLGRSHEYVGLFILYVNKYAISEIEDKKLLGKHDEVLVTLNNCVVLWNVRDLKGFRNGLL